ncbi:NHL repeat-containing protein [Microbacterium sp. ARD31]|uniref:NHL repeat-containing protein n=1 Tax=Microbacterium sp. ARD31 TaxID=2962576 RepID=UPI002881C64B|nr:NHL repeat-containing protein [Microbacterium sp. ARD31]MDT0187847.1 NHL repeat-containing protein [Microbacterium sp. ARD31]
MRRKLLLVVLLTVLVVSGLPASAHAGSGLAKLRVSVQGGIKSSPGNSNAYVEFTFTGRGCDRLDVFAEITRSPYAVPVPNGLSDSVPRNRLSGSLIAVPEPGTVVVGAWFAKSTVPLFVTAEGGTQCQGLQSPGAQAWREMTVTIPPLTEVVSIEPPVKPKDSIVNDSQRDDLEAAAKGGAAGSAIACAIAAAARQPAAIELCKGLLIGSAGSGAASLLDPPDPAFREMVESGFSARRFDPGRVRLFSCASGGREAMRRCSLANRLFHRWLRDTREMAWLGLAAGIAANREGNAFRRLTGQAREEVVSMHRTALLTYVGRYAEVSERRRPVASKLAKVASHSTLNMRFSLDQRRRWLRRLRDLETVPRSVRTTVARARLPLKAAVRRAARDLSARKLPATLSKIFASTSRLPHSSGSVLRGAGSDPASAWSGHGVASTLEAWLGGAADGLVGACDDPQLNVDMFGEQLAKLRSTKSGGLYSKTLARTLLRGADGVRRPCAETVHHTTYAVEPTLVAPPGDGAFVGATDFAVAPDGSVAVADPEAQTVVRYPVGGGPPVEVGGEGGPLTTPTNVALGPTGDMYVSDFDGDKVVHFAPDGTMLASWGTSGAAPGEFDQPSGLAVTPSGEVVVCDAGNKRLQVFSASGSLLRVIPGPPAGSPGHLEIPRGITVSSSGVVAVADRGDASVVLLRLSDGAYLGETAPTRELGEPSAVGLYQPYSVAFDPKGDLWVADRAGSQLVKLASSLMSQERSIWALGRGPSYALQPTDLEVASGRLLLLDYAGQKVISVPLP